MQQPNGLIIICTRASPYRLWGGIPRRKRARCNVRNVADMERNVPLRYVTRTFNLATSHSRVYRQIPRARINLRWQTDLVQVTVTLQLCVSPTFH